MNDTQDERTRVAIALMSAQTGLSETELRLTWDVYSDNLRASWLRAADVALSLPGRSAAERRVPASITMVGDFTLLACTDGTVWSLNASEERWVEYPSIPQPKIKP